jgi:hypothetical protein
MRSAQCADITALQHYARGERYPSVQDRRRQCRPQMMPLRPRLSHSITHFAQRRAPGPHGSRDGVSSLTNLASTHASTSVASSAAGITALEPTAATGRTLASQRPKGGLRSTAIRILPASWAPGYTSPAWRAHPSAALASMARWGRRICSRPFRNLRTIPLLPALSACRPTELASGGGRTLSALLVKGSTA